MLTVALYLSLKSVPISKYFLVLIIKLRIIFNVMLVFRLANNSSHFCAELRNPACGLIEASIV